MHSTMQLKSSSGRGQSRKDEGLPISIGEGWKEREGARENSTSIPVELTAGREQCVASKRNLRTPLCEERGRR